jgi:RTX calcium-binding nonapeptide repeat (4 copies)
VKRTLLRVFAAALALLASAPAASAEVIVGTSGDDALAGTDRRDFVYGRAGNDTIAGNGASDFLFGQRGDDTASGDAGRDTVWGGSGNDTLEGGGGPDALYGGRGLDVLEGGHDRDFLPRPRRMNCLTSSTAARGATVPSSAWATLPSTARPRPLGFPRSAWVVTLSALFVTHTCAYREYARKRVVGWGAPGVKKGDRGSR